MPVSPEALANLVRRWRFDFANHHFAKEHGELHDVKRDCQQYCQTDLGLEEAYDRFRAENHAPSRPPRWAAFTHMLKQLRENAQRRPEADQQQAARTTKEKEWQVEANYRQTDQGKREHRSMFRSIYEKAGFPVPAHLQEPAPEVEDVPEDEIPF